MSKNELVEQKRAGKPPKPLIEVVFWLVMILGTWIYELVRHVIEESGERKYPAIAHTNLIEYFMVAAIFLIAPLLGGISAVRLWRTDNPKLRRLGIFALFAFFVFFLFSSSVYWHDYQKYTGH